MKMNFVENMDYLEFMKSVPDNFIDCLITDSPYCSSGFLGSQGVRGSTAKKGEFKWFLGDNLSTSGWMWMIRSFMLECQRIAKPNISVLLFTDWRMFPLLVPVVESCGFRYKNLIIWDKGRMGLGRGFRPTHELIVEFSNGKSVYYSKSGSNVIRVPRVTKKEKLHSAQKPKLLIEELLKVCTNKGDMVMDVFSGSGVVAKTAIDMGRNFIGCDIDSEMCDQTNSYIARSQ